MQRQRLGVRDLLCADAALIAIDSAASALASATPINAFASRKRTSATGSLSRPTPNPTLNVLASSACSCANVEHHRLPVGRSWAHTCEGYRRPGRQLQPVREHRLPPDLVPMFLTGRVALDLRRLQDGQAHLDPWLQLVRRLRRAHVRRPLGREREEDQRAGSRAARARAPPAHRT
jgi:hypothetical protein